MPPTHEMLTDDYVADLLAKEASDCSLKYSAMGLDAFKPDKRPAHQPKPNTRFLNNIIRDTTSHNHALLAKENADSRARLRELEEAERRKRDEENQKIRRSRPGPNDTRKRMLGDIAAILGGPSKRRRPEEGDRKRSSNVPEGDERDEGNERDRKGKGREPRHREEASERKSHTRRDRSRDDHDNSRRHSHRHEKSRRDHRSASPEAREDRHRRHRARSPREKDDRRRSHHHLQKEETQQPTASSNRDHDSNSDSDPLDDIIGPAPPSKSIVRRRGRGTISAMSGIDSRFAADYDPTVDVTPDPDDAGSDDWDNAVETFRDRQKWKQQGADRLRAAGFTDEQIRKWEKGDKKDESDVTWNKAGGVREWDRGKVVDEDGRLSPAPASISVSASSLEFGRLKGT
ncbi:hypothetical protein F4808DRAFT_363390 [Astrocystis sublimbata]|nr:hypothetical protein F4808DRAFT_363390 [Astrocystis sublimbata]